MPTIEFDISDHVANLIDTAIQGGGPGDFNPGQQAAWDAVTCNISRAALIVNIAGRDVDLEVEIDVKCTGADYISEAVKELEEISNAMGSSVGLYDKVHFTNAGNIASTFRGNDILDVNKYVDQAFKSL